MAKLTYNNEIFTNVDKWSWDGTSYDFKGILLSSKLNQKNRQDYKLLDAIDIDWDGAWVKSLNTYINNTEDLINILDSLNKNSNIDFINNELERIWEKVLNIDSNYVTYSWLDNSLQKYQYKLIAGKNVSIDTNNIVSVYDLVTYSYANKYYTSLESFNNLVNRIDNDYYTKEDTNNVISSAVKESIDKLVGGADEAFDTLKEISDWILSQNRYVEVTPQEVIDNWKENTYFTFNAITQKYEVVLKKEDVNTSGHVKYYKLENNLTDVKYLIAAVNKLEDTVGYSYINASGHISYTGLLKDVQEIDEKSDYAVRLAGESLGTASNALDTALKSYNIAYASILSSYETYNLAYTAINISYESLTSSNIAYEVANKASYDVGYSTIYGTGYTPIEFNDISAYKDLGYIIYYYNSSKDIWYEALEPYNSRLQYHVYIPTIVGTGLTKRVEDVEDIVKYWDDKIENTTEQINQSLYNLTVENTSELINLEITPEEYNGDPHRNLLLNVYEGYINHVNGEIVNNGIINMYTLYNFYSYISSWEIIDINNLTKI